MFSKDRKIFWGFFILFYSAVLLWTLLGVNRQSPMYLAEAKVVTPLPQNQPTLPGALEEMPYHYQLNPTLPSSPVSDELLKKVIEKLALVPEWSPFVQYRPTLSGLRAQTDVRFFQDQRVVRVRAFSKDPTEAKQMADALATFLVKERMPYLHSHQILQASLPDKPFRPKRLRNFLVAALAGILIAFPAAHLLQESLLPSHPQKGEKT